MKTMMERNHPSATHAHPLRACWKSRLLGLLQGFRLLSPRKPSSGSEAFWSCPRSACFSASPFPPPHLAALCLAPLLWHVVPPQSDAYPFVSVRSTPPSVSLSVHVPPHCPAHQPFLNLSSSCTLPNCFSLSGQPFVPVKIWLHCLGLPLPSVDVLSSMCHLFTCSLRPPSVCGAGCEGNAAGHASSA